MECVLENGLCQWHTRFVTVKDLAWTWHQAVHFECFCQELEILVDHTGLFAAALVYDNGSVCRSDTSRCLHQKESYHPFVVSTPGLRALNICCTIARTSFSDFA